MDRADRFLSKGGFPGQGRAAVRAKGACHIWGRCEFFSVPPFEGNLVRVKYSQRRHWCARVVAATLAMAVQNPIWRAVGGYLNGATKALGQIHMSFLFDCMEMRMGQGRQWGAI